MVPPDFAAYVFDLTADRPIDLIGDHVHGWLIKSVSGVPELASRLHAPTRGKPFSLAFGSHRLGYWIRVSSIDSQLSSLLASLPIGPVEIGPMQLDCRRKSGPGAHHLAGAASPVEMWHNWSSDNAPKGRVTLRFASPTAFACDRGDLTLEPSPRLVFRSLIKTWNENTGLPIGAEETRDLLDTVRLVSSDVRVVSGVRFSTHRLDGFVGDCVFACAPDASLRAKQLLHMLSEFAFYAGVGLKRTMGMGMAISTKPPVSA